MSTPFFFFYTLSHSDWLIFKGRKVETDPTIIRNIAQYLPVRMSLCGKSSPPRHSSAREYPALVFLQS